MALTTRRDPSVGGGRAPGSAGRRAFWRTHAVALGILAAAILVRVVVTAAYQPALLFFDSTTYLDNVRDFEPKGLRPLGYVAFLAVAIDIGNLSFVAVLQHAMGLGMGVALYALLLRLGARPWIAALGAAPVLLDGFQVAFEHHLLAETLFEFSFVAACVLLLWRRRPTVAVAAAAGLALAVCALTRAVGMVAIGPALLAVVLLAPRRPWPALSLVLAFAIPVVGYAAWFQDVHGEFKVTRGGGLYLYGRVAVFADCDKVPVPPEERAICPTGPLDQRLYPSEYIWRSKSPLFNLPPGQRRNLLAGRFAKRVLRHQPLDYARTVARDSLRAFSTIAPLEHDDAPDRWRFKTEYTYWERATLDRLRRYGYERGVTRPDLARGLRQYQNVVHVPGPLLAVMLVVALLAIAGVGRARGSGLRIATFLLLFTALALFVGAVATSDFTWRYRMPLVVLVPPAAALALTALTRRRDVAQPAGDSRAT